MEMRYRIDEGEDDLNHDDFVVGLRGDVVGEEEVADRIGIVDDSLEDGLALCLFLSLVGL